MKLPEPSWLTLREVIELVMDRIGREPCWGEESPERKSVESRLSNAFLHGEIRTCGLCTIWDGMGEYPTELLPVPDEVWVEGEIDWALSDINTSTNFVAAVSVSKVTANREDLIKWLESATATETPTTHTASSGTSESPVYRSPYINLMLAAEAKFGRKLDSTGNHVKKHEIMDWLKEHWVEYVSAEMTDSLIRSMATLIRDPKLGRGGSKRSK